jgi:UDP-glucose 4-epimerase
MSTILVTGASGFIGSHLCQRLVRDGHEVHGVWRSTQPTRHEGIRWWRADLSDFEATQSLVRSVRPEVVFHLAGRVTGSRDVAEIGRTFQDVLTSTINMLTSVKETGCPRVVLGGSCEEPRPDEGPTPCSPYAAAKCSSTSYVQLFKSLYHLPVVVPRIFMVYGPGQQDSTKLVPYTILSMLRGERPKLSSGRRKVDWIYIDDVVEGLTRTAFAAGMQETSFDLGSGSQVSIREVVEQIAEIVGKEVEADFGALPDRLFDKDLLADTTFMERTFHWKPSVSLREGLVRTVDWYRRTLNVAAYVASIAFWAVASAVPDLMNLQEAWFAA